MSMHYGLSDYGRMRYMLQMADLLKIKKKYDPTNLFTVHKGVGSEGY